MWSGCAGGEGWWQWPQGDGRGGSPGRQREGGKVLDVDSYTDFMHNLEGRIQTCMHKRMRDTCLRMHVRKHADNL